MWTITNRYDTQNGAGPMDADSGQIEAKYKSKV